MFVHANLSAPEFPPGTPRFHLDFDLDGCALQLRAELVHGLLHLGGVLPGELDLRAAARTGSREPRPNLVERNRKGPAAARAGKAGFDPAHANRQSARSKWGAAASRVRATTSLPSTGTRHSSFTAGTNHAVSASCGCTATAKPNFEGLIAVTSCQLFEPSVERKTPL